MQTYTVQNGDTLYGISKQFGVSIDDIKKANNLTSNTIVVGSKINIPTSNSTYVVKRGDSLYSIAQNYNTTVDEIKKINNLTSNILSIGQVLKLPNSNLIVPEDYIVYIVKKGDSLYSIAQNYNTTVDSIKKINKLTSNILSIGQKLFISDNSNSANNPNEGIDFTYIVEKGDTLYSIAKKFNTTVDNLRLLNGLITNNLVVGQVLKISETQSVDLGKECYGTGYIEPKYETYTVKKGDSLYIIANRFNTSVDNLKVLNNLTSNNLMIGQVLKIRRIN